MAKKKKKKITVIVSNPNNVDVGTKLAVLAVELYNQGKIKL